MTCEVQNKTGPTWTAEPPLSLDVFKPRLDERQLARLEWS
jgi:hypothetical protein